MLTDAEKNLVLESLKALKARAHNDFIDGRTPNEWTNRFSWPKSVSIAKVKAVVLELEQAGKLECIYDGRGSIRSMKINGLDEITQPVLLPKVLNKRKMAEAEAKTESEKAVSQGLSTEHKTVIPTTPTTMLYRDKHRPTPKRGAAKRRHDAAIKGDVNEGRFCRLVEQFAHIFNQVMSGVAVASCSHSGRNNPKKGKIDLRDKHGDDSSLTIENGEGTFEFIWDVKSSRKKAALFNREIRLYSEQRNAKSKRAIAVNKYMEDYEIIENMINDISAGFDRVETYKDLLIKAFY